MATAKEQSDVRPRAVNVGGEAGDVHREAPDSAEERAAAASPSWERTVNAARAHAKDAREAKKQAGERASDDEEGT
jgi:hypothetical protein